MTGPLRSPRRVLVASGLTLGLAVMGVLLVRCSDEPPPRIETTAPSAAAAATSSPIPAGSPGPSMSVAGMPAGFSPDEQGAVAAGIAFATGAQRWLYYADEDIEAAIGQIATPAAAPGLSAQVIRDVAMARERLAASDGRIWWLVRPLAWHVDRFTGSEARISVWTTTILSAAEVAAPQAEYLTVTLDLDWLDGDWHVDGVRNLPGPTPMTGPNDQPWDAVPFDDALAGFTRLDGEPVQ